MMTEQEIEEMRRRVREVREEDAKIKAEKAEILRIRKGRSYRCRSGLLMDGKWEPW